MAHVDVDKLRQQLKKLKDREAQLEADLAINEHPELEEVVIQIVCVTSDLRSLSQSMRLVERPPEQVQRQIAALQTQIAFYKNKLEIAELQLQELTGGTTDKYASITLQYNDSKAELLRLLEEWQDDFVEKSINIYDLIPSIRTFTQKPADTTPE